MNYSESKGKKEKMKGRTSALTADRSEPHRSNIYRCRLISMFLFFGTARTFVRRSKGIKDASVFTLAERRGRRGSGLISVSGATSSTSCSTNWIKMLTAAPEQRLRGARLRFFPPTPLRSSARHSRSGAQMSGITRQ